MLSAHVTIVTAVALVCRTPDPVLPYVRAAGSFLQRCCAFHNVASCFVQIQPIVGCAAGEGGEFDASCRRPASGRRTRISGSACVALAHVGGVCVPTAAALQRCSVATFVAATECIDD